MSGVSSIPQTVDKLYADLKHLARIGTVPAGNPIRLQFRFDLFCATPLADLLKNPGGLKNVNAETDDRCAFIDNGFDLEHQMIIRNRLIEAKLVEQMTVVVVLASNQRPAPTQNVVTRWNHC
jgi:hypothetical protein